MKFEKIGFIGLGLIGGSLAKKIRELKPATQIYATAGHASTITLAHDMGLCQNKAPLEMSDFKDCDLIFLCAPVHKNVEYLAQLKNIIKSDCIITDVGSTKTEIHEKVIELGLEDNFIGGHPMTGSEKTGLQYSTERLFENTYYIITPTSRTIDETVLEFKDFVSSLGSLPLVLDYREHDHATAAISHLPHMIAYSLVNMVNDIDSENETMKTIAAGGFRDVTRIAASSPVMWQNICSSNKEQILGLMDKYMDYFDSLRSYIANDDSDTLLKYFGDAKEYRDSLFIPGNKIKDEFFEIYVDLPDEAGVIAIVASLLAFQNISIKNIGIVNNREFDQGVLRIEFYDSLAMERAVEILEERNYTIYRRG